MEEVIVPTHQRLKLCVSIAFKFTPELINTYPMLITKANIDTRI